MIFYLAKGNRIGFKEIPEELYDLIKTIPNDCTSKFKSKVTEDRLFPSPVRKEDDNEEKILEDWKAFVQPDLYNHFQSTLDIVSADIRQIIDTESKGYQLEFPLKHGEAWINTLNQARLILASNFQFTEKELGSDSLPSVFDERTLALSKIHFYAFMQQCIVEQLLGSK